MSDGTRFDPRFDPAFQPGYEGPIVPAAPAAERRAPEPPHIGAPPPGRPAPESAPGGGMAPADEPQVEDAPLAPGRNPFLIALGAMAVLLTVGGLYLVSRLRDIFVDVRAASEVDYVTLQVLMNAAPLVVVLGLATGIGVLFLLAARWKRR